MKVLNKEILFNDCQTFIEKAYEFNEITLIECIGLKENLADKIVNFILNEDFINNLILEQDKQRLHVTLNKNSPSLTLQRPKYFFLSIGVYIKAEFKRIIDIVFPVTKIKEMIDCMEDSKYEINFFEEYGNKKYSKLIFYRNTLALLPEANLMRKRYNRVESTLKNLSIKFDLFSNKSLANVGRKKVTNKTIFDNNFFVEYLINDKYPNADKDFFINVLKLNALESKSEIFWAYYSEEFKNIGFENKKELIVFNKKIEEAKKNLIGIEVYPEFSFHEDNIRLMIETQKKPPYKFLALKINTNDSYETFLDKEIHLSGTLFEDVKFENIYFKDYINNKEGTIDILKLLKY